MLRQLVKRGREDFKLHHLTCQDVAGMVRRLGSTKEIQACLLGIGQSLAIPVRLKPPQSHVDASIGKRPTASRERIGWMMRVEPLMYGKCGSRKGWAAVRICRSRHPF